MWSRTYSSRKILILAAFCAVAIISTAFMKQALELEDAEQAYYTQWWRWGYDDQPPLYTWIQNGVNALVGVHKGSFAILRALLFGSILLALFQVAGKTLHDRGKAVFCVLLLALIPVFIDFTFRRLSHTTFMALIVVVFYGVVETLMRKKTMGLYALMGVLAGMGMLAKYNFTLVLMAVLLASLWDRNLRKVVLHPYALITFSIGIILIAPHFYWLLDNPDFTGILETSVHEKVTTNGANGIPILSPIGALCLTLVKIIGPLFAVLWILGRIYGARWKRPETYWLMSLLLAQMTVVLLFFLFLDVQKVEERWLMPLFVPFAILIPQIFIPNAGKRWTQVGYLVFMAAITFQLLRTPIEKVMGIDSSVHYGFDPVAVRLSTEFPNRAWILPNVTYGGNVRILTADRTVFSLDDYSLPTKDGPGPERIVVLPKSLLGTSGIHRVLDSITGFGRHRDTLYFVEK